MVDNEKITKLNSKLSVLEEKKKDLKLKKDDVQDEYEQINGTYKKYKKERKISFGLIFVFMTLMFSSLKLVQLDSFLCLLAGVIGGCGMVGSYLAWSNLVKLEEIYSKVNSEVKHELDRVKSYINEIEELKALVNEKLYSSCSDNCLDDINELIDEEEYLNEVITDITRNDQKIRRLYIYIAKH